MEKYGVVVSLTPLFLVSIGSFLVWKFDELVLRFLDTSLQ